MDFAKISIIINKSKFLAIFFSKDFQKLFVDDLNGDASYLHLFVFLLAFHKPFVEVFVI